MEIHIYMDVLSGGPIRILRTRLKGGRRVQRHELQLSAVLCCDGFALRSWIVLCCVDLVVL